jgi:hypothetical protein
VKAKRLIVRLSGLAALGLALPCAVLGWREWRERTLLLRDLESSEPATRKAAALELGRLKSTSAIPKLVQLLESEARLILNEPFLTYPHPSYDAEEHIALVGAGTILIEVHYAARSLREIGVRAVPALAEALKGADEPWTQLQIIHVLHQLGRGANAAVPALMSALDSSDAWVPFNAALALATMGSEAKDALPALKALAVRHGPFSTIVHQVIEEIASKQASP